MLSGGLPQQQGVLAVSSPDDERFRVSGRIDPDVYFRFRIAVVTAGTTISDELNRILTLHYPKPAPRIKKAARANTPMHAAE